MSLLVWLPLNGNLNNQGIDNVTMTASDYTLDNNGKIGKCYKHANCYITNLNNNLKTYPMTICFWAKTDSTASWQLIVGIDNENLSQIHGIYVADSARIKYEYSPSVNINSAETSKWHHYAITINNGESVGYYDGVKNSSSNETVTADKIGRLRIGTGSNIYLNDLRIYDHILSAKEIELLARGLVMHYPLNDNSIQVMNNCFNYPTFNTSSSSGGWSHWGASGASGSYGQTTDKNYIYRKDQTYAHWFANASTGTNYYILYQEPAFDGGFRSLCCILKEENGKEINESICWPSWNANASGGATFNKWTSISPLGDGFYLCKCEGLKQDGSNDLVALDINPGVKIYVSECYLENDRTVCSDIFYSSDIIYDSSGYNYHGTKSGSLLCVNDTPRNSIATYFPSGTGSFSHPNITFSQYTISFWGKHTAIGKMLMGSNASISSLNTTWYWYGDKSFKYPSGEYYYTHNAGSEESLLNKWTHFVAVYDGSNITIYRNGVNEGSKAVTGNMTLDYLSIGNGYYSSSYWENGYISDFRIYTTALSEKAIQELYQMGASATKNGNLLTYEFKEY